MDIEGLRRLGKPHVLGIDPQEVPASKEVRTVSTREANGEVICRTMNIVWVLTS
jgi:hypothetical protein